MPKSADVAPEEYHLEENEERSMIEPKVCNLNTYFVMIYQSS